MRLVSRPNSKASRWLLPLLVISTASLSGCGTWLEELKAKDALLKTASLPVTQSGPRLPDLPVNLRTCLLKQSCQIDATKAKASGQPVPDCTTADGIVIAYVQGEREKRSCTDAMLSWWKAQQKIQADAATASKHPRSLSSTTKQAGWP